MDRVAYVLGAGFSAPLGLPLMRNFISLSKDLYFRDLERYSHFLPIFDAIDRLSKIKNYYSADLLNIEEILSILEMVEFVGGRSLSQDFTKYIADVVDSFTPAIPDHEYPFSSNWDESLFGIHNKNSAYCYFVSNLMGLTFERTATPNIHNPKGKSPFGCKVADNPSFRYSVISLNYDQVLENSAGYIGRRFSAEECVQFNQSAYDPNSTDCQLFKLHGCTNAGNIVPPTWAKGTHTEIAPIWSAASQAIRDANHIRFIGYSLPESDSYFKYFLKAAMSETKHLKSIDVLCLDPDGAAKSRFNEFVEYSGYRFCSRDVLSYFSEIRENTKTLGVMRKAEPLEMLGLEEAHDNFFS